jgi:hypothetical protein
MSPPVALAAASALPAAAGLPDLLPGGATPDALTLYRSVCSSDMSSQEAVSAEQACVLSAGLQGEESSPSANGSGGLALQLKVYASTC